MTNIEKLYELAKVDKIKTCYWNCKHSFPCKECCIYKDETVDFVYPPFTAEKQLELIKLLLKNINPKYNNYPELRKNGTWAYIHTGLTFEEALAEMIINASNIIGIEEIKRILE